METGKDAMRRLFTLLAVALLLATCSATPGGAEGDSSARATDEPSGRASDQASDANDTARQVRDLMLADGWTAEEAACVTPSSAFGGAIAPWDLVIVGWSAGHTIALDMRRFDDCGIGLGRIAEVTCRVQPGASCP